MPAWEGCEEEKCNEGEDYGDDSMLESMDEPRTKVWVDIHEIWEDNAVLECTRNPNQVERILVNANLACQTRGIVATQECSSIWIDTYPEVADPDL